MSAMRMKSGCGIVALAAVVATGCASEPNWERPDFGSSVNSMISNQSVEPEGGAPSDEPAGAVSGRKGQVIYDEYRKDTGKRDEVKNDIEINVGR